MRQRPALFVLVLALALTACGGGDDSSSDEPAVDDDNDDAADDDDSDEGLFDRYTDPASPGPYAVGVVTLFPVDASRHENRGDMDRVLPLEVWYPSTGDGGRPNTIGETLGEVPGWADTILHALWGDEYDAVFGLTTGALRDAPIVTADRPFPVYLFSHGYASVRFQNFRLCEHLASHGFVVVAPDHYGNALITNPPGDAFLLLDPLDSLETIDERNEDVAFLRAYLFDLASDPESPWYEKLDFSRFVVGGHSYGGTTAMVSGLNQPSVYAVAPSNPFWIDPFPEQYDRPFFVHLSEMDAVVSGSNPVVAESFARLASTHRVLLNMPTGTHYSATDTCLLVPELFKGFMSCEDETIPYDLAVEILSAYLTAFLRAVVTDDERYADYLRQNAYPADIELTTVWE